MRIKGRLVGALLLAALSLNVAGPAAAQMGATPDNAGKLSFEALTAAPPRQSYSDGGGSARAMHRGYTRRSYTGHGTHRGRNPGRAHGRTGHARSGNAHRGGHAAPHRHR